MKVLFLCKGNVGRSQMAEAFFNYFYPEKEVISAGTALSGPEQTLGSLLPGTKNVIDAMKEDGIDVSKNIRKQFTPKDVVNTELIVLLSTESVPEMLLPFKIEYWNIEDPKGRSIEDTRIIRDLIKKKVQELYENH